jgi:hypothetical protein
MLVSMELGADFSVGYAGKKTGHSLFATHPPPRLDSPTALFQPCSKSNTGVSSERSTS